MSTATFRKRIRGAPAAYPQWEAAGLRWLADAGPAGAPVVRVLDVGADHLDLERLEPAPATITHAEQFGRALAQTHGAGAPAFGAPPGGWSGDGFFGPADQPLPFPLQPVADWGDFYASGRILPMLELGCRAGVFDARDRRLMQAVARRAAAGEWRDDAAPSRCHGDLWNGNVMWTAGGAVLIDPAAHGGHAESDLAMLALFGAPHLGRIIHAYDEVAPLAAGWESRVELHQLFPVMVHAVLFGGGYVAQSRAIAARYA